MKLNLNDTKFLNKENDIKHKDILTIKTEGAWSESKKFKKQDGTPSQQFDITLELANGEDRSTTLSWANMKLLGEAFTDETENWVGKKVRAWKTKSEKATTGFVYFYVPTDWDRDDTGEWVKSETEAIDMSAGEADPADVPDFDQIGIESEEE